MVPIVKQLCPENRYHIKCPYIRTPSRVVIHNTANDAPAENEIAYMLNRPEEISFHYAVDDKKAVQGILEERNAWASGDGCGKGNMEGIHIEICYSLSGGERFTTSEQNAAQLTASILKKYGWGLDRVTKHQDYDGKYCPHRTLDLGWQRFLDMVKAELDKLNKTGKEEPELSKADIEKIVRDECARLNPTYNTLDEVPSYWQDDIRELVERGVIAGTGGGKLGLTCSEAKMAVIVKRAVEKM